MGGGVIMFKYRLPRVHWGRTELTIRKRNSGNELRGLDGGGREGGTEENPQGGGALGEKACSSG